MVIESAPPKIETLYKCGRCNSSQNIMEERKYRKYCNEINGFIHKITEI